MNWIAWIIAGVIASLVVLVIAEAGIRWWFTRQKHYYVWPPHLKLELHPNPEVFPELERVVRININRDGERGGEPPMSQDGLYRILVAGGSQAECGLLDQSTSWPGSLERILQRHENLTILGASRVHVGNVGRSGLSSAHLNLIFEKVLPRYRHLDAIVINIGGNDVLHWLIRGAQRSYQPPPVLAADTFSCHPEGPFRCRLKSTAAAELMRRLERRLFHPIKVRERSGTWVGDARAMRAQAKEIRTSVADPAEMLTNFELHFRHTIQMAKKHAERVLVVRQSWFRKEYTQEEASHLWHGGTGDPFKGDNVTVYYSFEVVSRLMEQIDVRAAEVASECCVEDLNLMSLLEHSLKTFYDYFHFTPAGAAQVAAAVAKTLIQPRKA